MELGSNWGWMVLGAVFTLLVVAIGGWALEIYQKKGGRL